MYITPAVTYIPTSRGQSCPADYEIRKAAAGGVKAERCLLSAQMQLIYGAARINLLQSDRNESKFAPDLRW